MKLTPVVAPPALVVRRRLRDRSRLRGRAKIYGDAPNVAARVQALAESASS